MRENFCSARRKLGTLLGRQRVFWRAEAQPLAFEPHLNAQLLDAFQQVRDTQSVPSSQNCAPESRRSPSSATAFRTSTGAALPDGWVSLSAVDKVLKR